MAGLGVVPASAETDVIDRAIAGAVNVQTAEATGTGFLTDQGIVTAAHVVTGADEVTISWSDGSVTDSPVVRRDATLDLALVSAGSKPAEVVALSLGDIPDLGDEVTVIAVDPIDETVLTRGIVSALPRQGDVRMVQIDAAVNRGTSGGPIVAQDGQVIGMVVMKDPLRDDAGRGHLAGDIADFLAGRGATSTVPTSRSSATTPPPESGMPLTVPVGIGAAVATLVLMGFIRGRRPRQRDELTIVLGPEQPVPPAQEHNP